MIDFATTGGTVETRYKYIWYNKIQGKLGITKSLGPENLFAISVVSKQYKTQEINSSGLGENSLLYQIFCYMRSLYIEFPLYLIYNKLFSPVRMNEFALFELFIDSWYNKISDIRNKISGPKDFVIPGFHCTNMGIFCCCPIDLFGPGNRVELGNRMHFDFI